MDSEDDFVRKMKEKHLKNLHDVIMQFAVASRDAAEHMLEAKELLPQEEHWYLEEVVKLANKFLLEKTGTIDHNSGLEGLSKNKGRNKPDWNDL